MSQTQRANVVCPLFNTHLQTIIRASRLVVAIAVVLAIVWPASAAVVTWNSTIADAVWSDAGNWGSDVPASNEVLFNATGSVADTGIISNVVDSDVSVNSLRYSFLSDTNYQTTYINPGVTLSVTGTHISSSSAGLMEILPCMLALVLPRMQTAVSPMS